MDISGKMARIVESWSTLVKTGDEEGRGLREKMLDAIFAVRKLPKGDE